MPEPRPIDEIIDAVLRDDENPPDEDYSPADAATRLSGTLSDADVRSFTFVALRRLPACLASSLLEPLLQSRTHAVDPDTFYDAVVVGRQVDTSHVVVCLLVEVLGISSAEVAATFLSRLDSATDEEVQDRLAYGLWFLRHSAPLVRGNIERQLRRADLSPYAIGRLQGCLQSDSSESSPDA